MCNAIGVHEIVLIGVINSCQWQIKCAGLQQSLFPCFVCELLPNKTTGRQGKWQGAREDKTVDFFHGACFPHYESQPAVALLAGFKSDRQLGAGLLGQHHQVSGGQLPVAEGAHLHLETSLFQPQGEIQHQPHFQRPPKANFSRSASKRQ